MRRRTGFEEHDLQVYDEEPVGSGEVYTGVPAGLNDEDIAIKVENVSMQFNLSQE